MKLNTLNTDIKNTIKDYVKFKFKNKDELKKAVNLWCENKDEALNYYGHISNWNTSLIKDMSELFLDKINFNDNINNWDVSNVINMNGMFYSARLFNKPLNSWDVSSVTNMSWMFYSAEKFNQPLNTWNIDSLTNDLYMFYRAEKFCPAYGVFQWEDDSSSD